MNVKSIASGALSLLMLVGIHCGAIAEVKEVRIATPYGIGWLPLIIMQQNKLLEKHATSEHLGKIRVVWHKFSGGNVMNEALLSDSLDIASGGVLPFLTLWEKTRNNLGVKGVCASSALPMLLNTSNPNVKTIKDFTDKDRIALAAVKVSGQAMVLQMASARAFGEENYAKLDRLTVGLGQPDAMAALFSRSVTAHFASAPYSLLELRRSGIHTVLNSYDVYGAPTTEYMVWTTRKFHDANPKTYRAFYTAFLEAEKIINDNKQSAARIYVAHLKASGGMAMSVQDVLEMLNNPQFQYDATPKNIMTDVKFLYKVGRLKTMPDSWKDLFFSEIHSLPGS